jgi:broad specificity phosphatase PhoE
MVTIIFETHATSADNEHGMASGHYDVGLSTRGREQARELGERHRNTRVDRVFCSDLERAIRTAEIAFSSRGLPITRDARLRDIDYGAWT